MPARRLALRALSFSSMSGSLGLCVLAASFVACSSPTGENTAPAQHDPKAAADTGDANHGHGSDDADPTTEDPEGSDGDSGPGGDAGPGSDSGGAADSGSGGGADGGATDTGGTSDTGGAIDAGGGSTCPPAPSGWRSMASAPVSDTATFDLSTWTGTEMLVTGNHAAYAYAPATNGWRTLAAPPFGGADLYQPISAWTGSQWIVFNGFDGAGSFRAYAFDPATNAWTSIAAPPLTARAGLSAAWAPATHELVVWGGSTRASDSVETGYADGAAYDPTTHTWRSIANAPFEGMYAQAAWSGGRVVAIFPSTGKDCECRRPLALAAAYDPIANAWTSLSTPTMTPRIDANVAVFGPGDSGVALLFGDRSAEDGDYPNLHDGGYWDGTTSSWKAIPAPFATPALSRRISVTTWSANGRLYAWGGNEYATSVPTFTFIDHDDGASFDPATGAWTAMPAGAPSPRSGAVGVWTGCDAIVFGGASTTASGTTTHLRDGKLFRP